MTTLSILIGVWVLHAVDVDTAMITGNESRVKFPEYNHQASEIVLTSSIRDLWINCEPQAHRKIERDVFVYILVVQQGWIWLMLSNL